MSIIAGAKSIEALIQDSTELPPVVRSVRQMTETARALLEKRQAPVPDAQTHRFLAGQGIDPAELETSRVPTDRQTSYDEPAWDFCDDDADLDEYAEKAREYLLDLVRGPPFFRLRRPPARSPCSALPPPHVGIPSPSLTDAYQSQTRSPPALSCNPQFRLAAVQAVGNAFQYTIESHDRLWREEQDTSFEVRQLPWSLR